MISLGGSSSGTGDNPGGFIVNDSNGNSADYTKIQMKFANGELGAYFNLVAHNGSNETVTDACGRPVVRFA